jgi:hypothetical protein
MIAQDPQVAASTDSAAVALFNTHEYAEAAVKKLAENKFDVRKITVIGRGFHTEDHVAGFYNMGDRVKFWGKWGAFWGALWGILFGGLYIAVPLLGPVFVVGHLTAMVAAAIESAVVVGGLSALGAALYGIGIPKDSVVRYEAAIKADGFMLMLSGTPSEVERARAILQNMHPTELNIHENINVSPSVIPQKSSG